MKSVYIIMPVYNEAAVVGDVVKQVRKQYENLICVDDGSSDDSASICDDAGAIVVSHAINLGAGGATQTGIDYALQDPEAEYFVTIDADGQHDVADISNMVEFLQTRQLNVVFGSRFLGKVENISRTKRLLLRTAAIFTKSTSGVNLSDPHNGIRVFDRNFAENLKLTLPDFSHASEIVHRIQDRSYKYGEYPVTVRYTEYSKRKGQPMLNAINISFDLLLHRLLKK